MLDKHQMNSFYRDPYLSAVHFESNVGDAVTNLSFMGHETTPRWMVMSKSGIEIRCTQDGFVLKGEANDQSERIRTELGLDADNVLHVPKVDVDGKRLDAVDRVQVGANMLRLLVEAGL
jgi:hypothetical protein